MFARNSYYILMKIFNIFFYECRLLCIPLCLNIFFMMTWFNMYILIKCHKCFKMFLKLLLPQYWYQERFSKKKNMGNVINPSLNYAAVINELHFDRFLTTWCHGLKLKLLILFRIITFHKTQPLQ